MADRGLVDVTAHALQVLAVVLPLLACFLILGRIGLRWSQGLARWSRGSALKRVAAAALSTAVITSLLGMVAAAGHLPAGRTGGEGLLTALLPAAQSAPVVGATPASARVAAMVPDRGVLPVGASAERRLAGGEPLEATFPEGTALPTKSDPQLAIVLVPSEDDGDGQPPTPTPAPAPDEPDEAAEPWVFPFDEPLPPAEGTTRRRRTTPPTTR